MGVHAKGMITTQKPTVGRIVHYQPLEEHPVFRPGDTEGRTGQPWAAIISEVVDEDTVRLHLITPTDQNGEPMHESGTFKRADSPTPGRWNWPPRD